MKELVEYEKEIRGLLDEMDDKPSSRKHVIDRFRQLIIYFEERLDLSKSNSDYEEERIKELEEESYSRSHRRRAAGRKLVFFTGGTNG